MSAVWFVLAVILIVCAWIGWRCWRTETNPIDYFKTKNGLKILKGIVLAVIFTIVGGIAQCAIASETGWFKEAYIYAGIDHVRKQSPQCQSEGIDKHATSNIGLRGSIYSSKKVRWYWNYTHHSCAFNQDRNGYDGIGTGVELRIW